MTEVVNIKKYIGKYIPIHRPSKWGNPYSHLEKYKGTKFYCETREESIKKYESYLLSNESLMNDLHELQGKVLGCFCKPKSCHGDILKKYIDKLETDKLKLF